MTEEYPRLFEVVFDTTDARGLAEFYRQLLGWQYQPGDEPPAAGQPDPNAADWLVLRDPKGTSPSASNPWLRCRSRPGPRARSLSRCTST
jgi:hypothetical protein